MSYKKRSLFYLKKKNYSEISPKFFKKIVAAAGVLFALLLLFLFFQIYIPVNPVSQETIVYTVEKGLGDEDIAKELQKLGIIRSNYFFRFYVVTSFQHSKLQAGKYNLSPRMSAYQIVKKMVRGDVIKNKLTILEGWDLADVGTYLEEKEICKKEDFISLAEKDYSASFDFLSLQAGGKPSDVSLEGYIFPDTYELAVGEGCEDVISVVLTNFGKKLSSEIRSEIAKQKKTIFDVVTMASMIEKEVRTMEDKKIVSGILWKRLEIGMPLQIDATVNYITGKSDAAALIKDTKIDSPYNTYKYKGLPKGPISNPGLNSILAALNPKKTDYLFYLSNGATIYSRTFEEHVINKAKYLQ